jgi:hypothetical protein
LTKAADAARDELERCGVACVGWLVMIAMPAFLSLPIVDLEPQAPLSLLHCHSGEDATSAELTEVIGK